jgi:hypothetical protein
VRVETIEAVRAGTRVVDIFEAVLSNTPSPVVCRSVDVVLASSLGTSRVSTADEVVEDPPEVLGPVLFAGSVLSVPGGPEL